MKVRIYLQLITIFSLVSCGNSEPEQQSTSSVDTVTTQEISGKSIANVNTSRIINADSEPGNWMSHGRTYDEQRYSPLDEINADNVSQLGLAWYVDLDTDRGQEATPIVVDGVMYISTAWSKVKAIDAKTGEILWEYDPEVPLETGSIACCDVVNRGVAVWEGKVYVGTLDGRLNAIDAETGKELWSVVTVDQSLAYTITGAPRIINGLVMIGNGGAEYAVRGYITAYDAETSEQVWRFYTVPGDPSSGFESEAMEIAAQTWAGEWWQYGGGGTVWDSMAYDPELDLLYIGVGNGAPWNHSIRSNGEGDNLFLSSIVALKAGTGEYVWHYQTTPGDTWDYTATQHIVLADLKIEDQQRQVLMQIPKNGFFYVIDRATGELLSADAIVYTNWASHVDMETGRPVENPNARYNETGDTWLLIPGPMGAHSWQPMSFHPGTGLVYIPVNEAPFYYRSDPDYQLYLKAYNTGIDMSVASLSEGHQQQEDLKVTYSGHLAAWDPVNKREVWRVPYPVGSNGGLLSTAGNLVIQGTAMEEMAIYRADNGEKLWSMGTQTGVIAAPVTYELDGEQYIAVLAGWGGVIPMVGGAPDLKSGPPGNKSRVLVYKLDGEETLPPVEEESLLTLNPPEQTASPETIGMGAVHYHRRCLICHGAVAISGGLMPDLRYSTMPGTEAWFEVVGSGTLSARGMPAFNEILNREQIAAIQAFVIEQAHVAKAKMSDE